MQYNFFPQNGHWQPIPNFLPDPPYQLFLTSYTARGEPAYEADVGIYLVDHVYLGLQFLLSPQGEQQYAQPYVRYQGGMIGTPFGHWNGFGNDYGFMNSQSINITGVGPTDPFWIGDWEFEFQPY